MTEIDFVVDDVVLREDASLSPETQDPAVLEVTCFEMPVRLRVGDVELLEWTHRVLAPGFLCNESGELVPHEFLSPPPVPWIRLPLIGLVAAFRGLLQNAEPGRSFAMRVACEPLLTWTRRDRQVDVESAVNGRRATAEWQEVAAAILGFCDRVGLMLASRIPALPRHPLWSSWFP